MLMRTCLTTSMYDATRQGGQQEPWQHDCMLRMTLQAQVFARTPRESSIYTRVFYGQSDHAGTGLKGNTRSKAVPVGLPVRFSDGWWDHASRQMKKEAPLENGRNARRQSQTLGVGHRPDVNWQVVEPCVRTRGV